MEEWPGSHRPQRSRIGGGPVLAEMECRRMNLVKRVFGQLIKLEVL